MSLVESKQPTAFVIMPFGAAFDDIYSDFIQSQLASAGFAVTRADEITSSEIIMSTIIRQMEDACLVVADLTDSNPNVYYELALAHAMHKPVILLTQDIDELPFDIKAVQAIEYTRDFTRMDAARAELKKAAEGTLTGDTWFNNPYSDYRKIPVRPGCADQDGVSIAVDSSIDEAFEDEPLGIFEHQAAVEEGFDMLRQSTESIGIRTTETASKVDSIAKQMTDAEGRSDVLRHRRQLAMILAQELNSFGRFLADQNGQYSEAIESTRPSLEAALVAEEPNDEEGAKSLENLLETIAGVEDATRSFRDSIGNAADSVSEMPHVERSLTRARNLVVEQMRRLAGNIDQVLSMLARAKAILEAKSG